MSVKRNITLFPWFMVAVSATFWLPVFFLYFAEQLTLDRVLQLEAVYYAAVFMLEVPSGYFSDRLGRRPTLIVAALSFVVAYALFFLGDSFGDYAVAQVFLAGGFAFISGTDSAFHFDSLKAVGRESEFAAREASVVGYSALATGLAAVIGGLIAMVDLRLVYGLSFGAAMAMLVVAILFVEPPVDVDEGDDGRAVGPVRQLKRCAVHLRRPHLRWLFIFAVAAYAINHVPYELYQSYTSLVFGRWHFEPLAALHADQATPLVTGVMTGITMVLRSWAARRSIDLRDKWGLRRVLLFSMCMQVGIITICGTILHPTILFILLLRSAPTGLQKAPISAAVVPQLSASIRATYLSVQTLCGRLIFTCLLLSLSAIVGAGSDVDWSAMSSMAIGSGVLGTIVIIGLVAFGSPES